MRVFGCHDCQHLMRLTGKRCGKCHVEKLVYQRLSTYVAVFVGILFLALLTFAFN